ncbi:MAG: tetratricopeptide repeat protein [Acidobacteriia bacterium]|nr:tetratricopeptide repeat protein [Terriglobia bacterium]
MVIMSVTAALWVSFGAVTRAESVASKNKQGNQLFEQGKYQDAEKAYLEAQTNMPGRPELSYNLGNSLIKQKKYDQALQALRQAVSKGDKGLQANGWYNVGNALFDMGGFGDSAQAYIQALRINPSDRDAKHNLELALRKKQEQEQQQKGQGQTQESSRQKPEGGQNEEKGRNEPKPPDKQGQQPQSQEPPGQKPANPQSSQSVRPEGAFSKERALQILDALQNQELAEQRKLLERRARKKATGRDW